MERTGTNCRQSGRARGGEQIKQHQQTLSQQLLLRALQIVAPADESVHTTS